MFKSEFFVVLNKLLSYAISSFSSFVAHKRVCLWPSKVSIDVHAAFNVQNNDMPRIAKTLCRPTCCGKCRPSTLCISEYHKSLLFSFFLLVHRPDLYLLVRGVEAADWVISLDSAKVDVNAALIVTRLVGLGEPDGPARLNIVVRWWASLSRDAVEEEVSIAVDGEGRARSAAGGCLRGSGVAGDTLTHSAGVHPELLRSGFTVEPSFAILQVEGCKVGGRGATGVLLAADEETSVLGGDALVLEDGAGVDGNQTELVVWSWCERSLRWCVWAHVLVELSGNRP